ncbi:cytochrome C [candidate division KSB1 bacterium]|nr:cytochrome C [candidate division KSB1 bacterium]
MKFLKILLVLFLLLIVALAGAYIYFMTAYPKVGLAPGITLEPTPEKLERGRYLANYVSSCIDCHSHRNWDYFAGPVIPNTEGMGGEIFKDVFGVVFSKNITPAALRDWTDGELFRAIASCVDKNGDPLAPMMPYDILNEMSQQDLCSIILYIRTLKPIENEIPTSNLKFPFNIIFRTLPKPYESKPTPSHSDTLAYGRYLSTIGGCQFCHTPRERGRAVPGKEFTGGHGFPLPFGLVRSVNITPDEETGIGAWSMQDFIDRFKSYEIEVLRKMPVAEAEFNTVMPWTMFSGMTSQDLTAIYKYLRTVKPLDNSVEKFVK